MCYEQSTGVMAEKRQERAFIPLDFGLLENNFLV